jgi:HSP20 family molecular chaperone IbpA
MYEVIRSVRDQRPLFAPDVDIHDVDDAMVMIVDLPGVGKDSLELWIEDSVLTIFGRVEPLVGREMAPVYREYRDGDFFRSFILSDQIDAERISAELSGGVLTLRLPKSERPPARHIRVAPSK